MLAGAWKSSQRLQGRLPVAPDVIRKRQEHRIQAIFAFGVLALVFVAGLLAIGPSQIEPVFAAALWIAAAGGLWFFLRGAFTNASSLVPNSTLREGGSSCPTLIRTSWQSSRRGTPGSRPPDTWTDYAAALDPWSGRCATFL